MKEQKGNVVSTRAVAQIVGASVAALSRAAYEQKFPLPEKNAAGRFLWRESNIESARQYFHRRPF